MTTKRVNMTFLNSGELQDYMSALNNGKPLTREERAKAQAAIERVIVASNPDLFAGRHDDARVNFWFLRSAATMEYMSVLFNTKKNLMLGACAEYEAKIEAEFIAANAPYAPYVDGRITMK